MIETSDTTETVPDLSSGRSPFVLGYIFVVIYLKDFLFEVAFPRYVDVHSSLLEVALGVVAVPIFGVIFAAFASGETNPWVRVGYFGLLTAVSISFTQTIFVYTDSVRFLATVLQLTLALALVAALHWDRRRPEVEN